MDAKPAATHAEQSIQFPRVKSENVHAKMKSLQQTDNLAWIFSDRAGLRQRLLQELNFKTVHYHHDLHSRAQCHRLLNELALQKPAILWIRFAGPCAGSGNRQDALRAEHLVRLIMEQKHSNRLVVVEASERSQVWNLQVVKECMKALCHTVHLWCRYETALRKQENPCNSKIRLLTNFHVSDDSECKCGLVEHVRSRELGSSANARFEHVLRMLMKGVCSDGLVLTNKASQMPAKGQPESKEPIVDAIADDVNLDVHGLKKTVRFSSLHSSPKDLTSDASHSCQEQPPEHVPLTAASNVQTDFWISSGQHQLLRVHVNPRNRMFQPTDGDCPIPTKFLHSCRQTKMQQCHADVLQNSQPLVIDDNWRTTNNVTMNFQWVGTTGFTATPQQQQSYPTEKAIRQKQKKAEGHIVQPKRKYVEQHSDDCGENFDILQIVNCTFVEPMEKELFAGEHNFFDKVCLAVGDPRCQFFGSQAETPPKAFFTARKFATMNLIYHQRLEIAEDGIDCMEMFGGAGTTTFVLAKFYGLKTGVNFELSCGVDLTRSVDIHFLFAYIKRNKPKVILLAPPCKGYSKWGHLNRKINYQAWVNSRKLSVPLARLSGDVALEQVSNDRHFFIEQPHPSGLFEEPQWKRLAEFMFSVVFDQCMTGLRMSKHPWWPVRKTTECRASHPMLLLHLQNLRCDGSHPHAHIGSWSNNGHPTVRSVEMQVWPKELCERIAAGVAEFLITTMSQQHSSFFPAACSGGDAAEEPSGFTCPACKNHMRKTDPKHKRDETCRFPDVESISWSCPGCVARRNRGHDSHTNDEKCQWAIARSMPEGSSRERGSTHPRDGRVPASADPTSRLRLDGRNDGVPGSERRALEDVAERLTPEQAEARRRAKGEASASAPIRRVNAEVQAEEPRPATSRPSGPAEELVPRAVPAEAVAERDAEAIVEAARPPTDGLPLWSKHDLGFALQQLRSIRIGIVRRTLRKLHIRWYHASSKKMQTLLQAAGVSPDVLCLVPSIVDTCDICRSWQRVGPRSVASTRLPEAFNKEVQMDLLFYKTHIILHCIDACTRWTSVHMLPNREPSSIVDGFAACWLRLFGPPATVLSDQEGGLISDLACEWFDRRGIQLTLRAREQHAGMVERHHEILRRQLHLLEGQASSEGLAVPFTAVLAEAVFAKNAMFQCGNVSPYEAVFGRPPPLLATVGEESGEGISDRDAARIRHLAVSSMIQATADQKARIADSTKTRRAGELLDLHIGDLVDFFRRPVTKDASGWHGPAEVVSLSNVQEGLLYVKWQGRVIAVRIQDARRALIFATFLMRATDPIRTFKSEIECQHGQALRLGWMRQGGNWVECHANKSHSTLLAVGLYISAVCMNLQGVIGFRCGTSLNNLPAIAFDDTLLLWWNVDSAGLAEWYHCFMPGTQPLNVPRLTGNSNVALVQFFMVDMTEVMSLRQVAPDVPHLGGSHEPGMPDMHDQTEVVMRTKGPKPLQDEAVQKPSSPKPTTAEPKAHAPGNAPAGANPRDEAPISEVDNAEYGFSFQHVTSDIAFLGMCYDSMPASNGDALSSEIPHAVDDRELDEPPEFLFGYSMLQFVTLNANPIKSKFQRDQMLSISYAADTSPIAVIERTNNILKREEALTHVEECREAMILELMRWVKHKAWRRGKLHEATNVLKSKWVLKWKDISDGTSKTRKIKARLVAQGFLDRQATETFAGTSTRWSQRLLITIAVQRRWNLWSADISEVSMNCINRAVSLDKLRFRCHQVVSTF